MKSLNADIKNQSFEHIYLLAGEEGYLRKTYTKRLVDAMAPGVTMNVSRYSGSGIKLQEVTDVSQTLPFMGARRVIVLENTGLFVPKKDEDKPKTKKKTVSKKTAGKRTTSKVKKAPEEDEDPLADFVEYMAQLPPTSFFIFSEESVDKRSRLYKAVSACGRIVEMKTQTPEVLVKWLVKLAADDSKILSPGGASLMVSMVGSDMNTLFSEWQKLSAYCMDRDRIEADDISLICTRTLKDRIFSIMDDISDGKPKSAFAAYSDIKGLGTHHMVSLNIISRHIKRLYDVSEYMYIQKKNDRPVSGEYIARMLGVREYLVDKYMKQARSFGIKRLRAALEDCAETEHSIKSGRIDGNIGVEILLASLIQGRL